MSNRKGLWYNIRKNKGSGKKPTADMLKQEEKIKANTGKGKKYFSGLGAMSGGFKALGTKAMKGLSDSGGGGPMGTAKGILNVGRDVAGFMGSMGDSKASKVSNILNSSSSALGSVGDAFKKQKEIKTEAEEKRNEYFSDKAKAPDASVLDKEGGFDEALGYKYGKSNLKTNNMKYGKMFPGGRKKRMKESVVLDKDGLLPDGTEPKMTGRTRDLTTKKRTLKKIAKDMEEYTPDSSKPDFNQFPKGRKTKKQSKKNIKKLRLKSIKDSEKKGGDFYEEQKAAAEADTKKFNAEKLRRQQQEIDFDKEMNIKKKEFGYGKSNKTVTVGKKIKEYR